MSASFDYVGCIVQFKVLVGFTAVPFLFGKIQIVFAWLWQLDLGSVGACRAGTLQCVSRRTFIVGGQGTFVVRWPCRIWWSCEFVVIRIKMYILIQFGFKLESDSNVELCSFVLKLDSDSLYKSDLFMSYWDVYSPFQSVMFSSISYKCIWHTNRYYRFEIRL